MTFPQTPNVAGVSRRRINLDHVVAIDTETHLFTTSVPNPKLVCAQFSSRRTLKCPRYARKIDFGNNELVIIAKPKEAKIILSDILKSGKPIVFHNSGFDFLVLVKAFPDLEKRLWLALLDGRIFDTQIIQQLNDIARGAPSIRRKSLNLLAEKYLGASIKQLKKGSSTLRLKYAELEDLPIRHWSTDAIYYAAMDAHLTLNVFVKISHLVASHDDAYAQTRTSIALRYCAINSPNIDEVAAKSFISIVSEQSKIHADFGRKQGFSDEVIKRNSAAISDAIISGYKDQNLEPPRTDGGDVSTAYNAIIGSNNAAINQWLQGAAISKGSIGEAKKRGLQLGFLISKTKENQKKLRDLVARSYHGNSAPKTDGGKTSISADALLGSFNQSLIRYGEGKRHSKMMSTYVPPIRKAIESGCNLISSRPNTLVATGRSSWSYFQNPPRKGGFRECFQAREGHVFGFCDWSTAELRSWSQICLWEFGYSKMANAFKKGIDPHTLLAASLRGCTYEEAIDFHKKGQLFERIIAKVANFGFLGGMGPRAFVEYALGYGLEIPEERAAKILKAFLKMWPEAVAYFKLAAKRSKSKIVTQYVSKRRRGHKVIFTSTCNTFFQGLTADYAKSALTFAWFESRFGRKWNSKETSPFKGVKVWLLLHDELCVEGPIETSHLWGDRLRDIMNEVASHYLPDIPQKSDIALSKIWTKSAGEVRCPNTGKLLIWSKTA